MNYTLGFDTSGDVQAYLERYTPREPGTKIQYGHPSPRFWEDRKEDLDTLLAPIDPEKQLTLYLHIPFCPPTDPDACGFCLFAREDFNSYKLVENYVDDLLAELERHHEKLGRRKLRAIYFGGGTPNILRPVEIRRIFERLRRDYDLSEVAEITFEGTPALFTMSRLECLAEVGVTRISVGAQSLKPRLIKYSGRKQRPEQIRRAAQFCADNGLFCSVDLITGWFEQTPQDLVDDIDQLTDWGVTGIVNHPLTIQGDSEFARNQHKLPPVDVTCRSFLVARERLLELGYRADSYTDYRKAELPVVEYLELYRDILYNDRLGVGYGANSLFSGTRDRPGHTYKNVAGMSQYHASVRDDPSCQDMIFRFTREDVRLLYILKGLEGHPYLDADAYRQEFGRDLREDYAPWWKALEERSWLVWGGGKRPKLVGEGVFYTSTIQRAIAEPRNQQLRAELHQEQERLAS